MKLRIHEQSLRIRLSPSEVDQLRETKSLEQETRLGPAKIFRVFLEIGGEHPEVLAGKGLNLGVRIPAGLAGEWLEGKTDGVQVNLAAGDETLTLLVETDRRP